MMRAAERVGQGVEMRHATERAWQRVEMCVQLSELGRVLR